MTNNISALPKGNRIKLPEDWLDSPFSEYMEVTCLANLEKESYCLEFDERFIGNPSLRAFHGGIVATFIEAVSQFHLFKEKQQVSMHLPETITIDYLRPALSEKLTAIPEVIRIGKSVSTIAVSIYQKEKIVAKGRVIFTD